MITRLCAPGIRTHDSSTADANTVSCSTMMSMSASRQRRNFTSRSELPEMTCARKAVSLTRLQLGRRTAAQTLGARQWKPRPPRLPPRNLPLPHHLPNSRLRRSLGTAAGCGDAAQIQRQPSNRQSLLNRNHPKEPCGNISPTPCLPPPRLPLPPPRLTCLHLPLLRAEVLALMGARPSAQPREQNGRRLPN